MANFILFVLVLKLALTETKKSCDRLIFEKKMVARLHQPSIRLGFNPPEWSQLDGEQRVTTTCTGCSVSVDEPLVVEIQTKNGLVSTLDKKVPVA